MLVTRCRYRCSLAALTITAGIGCARPSGRKEASERPSAVAGDAQAADERTISPAWGELPPGPYGVGYRVLAFEDSSRSYRLHTETAAHPRPLIAGVWYPAKRETGETLTLGDYFTADFTGDTEPGVDPGFARIISDYLEGVVVEEVFGGIPELLSKDERAQLDRALGTAAMAREDAVLAVTEGPLLLAHPGLGGVYPDNMVLYEVLASHGWVVVAGLFQQARGNWINVDWDPSNSVQDLDVLRREAPSALGYSPSAVASLGHSYGAQAALVYASLPDRVQAVVSLDSTMDRDPPWWKDDDHGPWLDRAGLIEVPALLLFQAEQSRSFFDEIAAPRELVTAEGLEHNDFEGLRGVLRPLAGACASEVECQLLHRRYLAIVSLTTEFLESTLRPASSRPRSLDDSALSALGMRRVRVPEPSAIPPAARALSPLDAVTPDCRDDDSCDPVERASDHASELLALGRAEEALAMLKPHLEGPAEHGMLRYVQGRALAMLGRYSEAAEAYEAERASYDGPKASSWAKAMGQRARDRAERARALAEIERSSERDGGSSGRPRSGRM